MTTTSDESVSVKVPVMSRDESTTGGPEDIAYPLTAASLTPVEDLSIGAPVMTRNESATEAYSEFLNSMAKLVGFDVYQVRHNVELLGWEKDNQYRIHALVSEVQGGHEKVLTVRKQLLHAQEKSGTCERQYFGGGRTTGIKLHLGDSKTGTVIARWHKPFHVQGSMCCRPYSKMRDANDQLISTGTNPFRCCATTQNVYDEAGNLIYCIKGPLVLCKCASHRFNVFDARTDTKIGIFRKSFDKMAGALTNTNRFRIQFPASLPVNHKLALLGALFQLDFSYFERSSQ